MEVTDTPSYNSNIQPFHDKWNEIFKKYSILDEIGDSGQFFISAKELKEFGEPRLLAKADSRFERPTIMRENNLSILPCNSRGSYVIGYFDAYKTIKKNEEKSRKVLVDENYDTLDPFSLNKEPAVILSAFNYGIFNHIVQDDNIRMTDYGRGSTSEFDYEIKNLKNDGKYDLHVGKSQMEVDGVFESVNTVLIVECKNRRMDDFIIRQLYYPYRTFREKTRKRILNVFLSHSLGTITADVYEFKEEYNYNSLQLVDRHKLYFHQPIHCEDVLKIINSATILPEPDVPFPQANSVDRVVDATKMIRDHGYLSAKDLAFCLSVEPRQGDYYGNACRYLGLAEAEPGVTGRVFKITDKGQKLLDKNPRDQIVLLIELVSQHDVFNRFMQDYLERGVPQKKSIAEYLVCNRDLSESTAERRAETVLSWLHWFMDKIGE